MSGNEMNRGRAAIASFAAVALVLALSVLAFASVPARAGTGPFNVAGTVTDSIGDPVEGATVTVTIVEKSVSKTAFTDVDGIYDLSLSGDEFGESDYDVGDTIRVVATKGGDTGSNQTELTQEMQDSGFGVVDVRFGYEIPEFGGLVGTMVAMIAVGAIGSLIFLRRKR